MNLREENMSTQYSLRDALDRAYEEGTLEEFIGDYVGWVGTIEDIKAAQQESSIVEESDIERALKNLYREGLLKEEKDPYEVFCEALIENFRDYEDEQVLEHIRTTVYWPHMGSTKWEEAYSKFEERFNQDPLQFYHECVKEMKEGQYTLLEGWVFEGLNPSRLTTAGAILRKMESGEKSAYQKEEAKFKAVAKMFKLDDYTQLVVYQASDSGLFGWFKRNIEDNKGFFKRAFKAAFDKTAPKALKVSDVVLYKADGVVEKGRVYPELGLITEAATNRFYFSNKGAFQNVSELLDQKGVSTSGETNIEAEVATAADEKVLADRLIKIYKTDVGKYYATIDQLPEFKDSRFDSEEDLLDAAKNLLKKNGYNFKEFKIKRFHQEEKGTGNNVKRDKRGNIRVFSFKKNGKEVNADPAALAFIVDGKVLNYDNYVKLNDKQKKSAIIVRAQGVLNREITESFDMCATPEVCVDDVLLVVPDHIEIVVDGPDYCVNNKECETSQRGCYVDGDLADKIEFLYKCFIANGGCGSKDNFVEELNEAVSVEETESTMSVQTVEDLIAGLVDNVPDEQIDREIKFFKKVSKLLDVENYDKLNCIIDDGEHDPSLVFGQPIDCEIKGRNVVMYPEGRCVVEKLNGLLYIFFANEYEAQRFVELSNKFMTEYEVANVYEAMSDTIEENNVVDIYESLNKIDRLNNNKYDLVNLYLSERLSKKQIGTLCKMLQENCNAKQLYNYLSNKSEVSLLENYRNKKSNMLVESTTDDDSMLDTPESEVESENVEDSDETIMLLTGLLIDSEDPEGSMTVEGDSSLEVFKKVCEDNSVYYEVRDLGDGNYDVYWNRNKISSSTKDELNANKKIASTVKEKLLSAVEYVEEILRSSDPTYSAATFVADIEEVVKSALDLCKEFDY